MEFVEMREGLARILVPKAERIYDAPPVFYNPVMALNRDLSVLAVDILKPPRKVLDALSATGIRGVRYASRPPQRERSGSTT